MQTGASEEKIRQVPGWRQSALFTPMERDALEYAEQMTITGEKVTDELWARLRGHFSEAQLVELTAAVALENFRSKFNVPLGVPSSGPDGTRPWSHGRRGTCDRPGLNPPAGSPGPPDLFQPELAKAPGLERVERPRVEKPAFLIVGGRPRRCRGF